MDILAKPIGIGVNSVFTKQGHSRAYDGIGQYTFHLMQALTAYPITCVPCYFNLENIFFSGDTDFLYQLNPFLSDIFPFYFHRRLEKKISLYHSTDHFIPKLKNTPIVATLHDATFFKGISYQSTWKRKIKNTLLKKHAQYADHIIAVSQFAIADIIHYWNIAPEKISVVYNGIDSAWFDKTAEDERARILQKYAISKKFMLSVGTLYPKKNIDKMLSAYLALPHAYQQEYDYVIVGKKGHECDELVARIKKEQHKGHVKWLDYVAFHELRALYQSASLLLFTSLEEGFGFPILEANACRIPVITSNISSMPEIAGDTALLVEPTSIESISAAIPQALDDFPLEKIEAAFTRAKTFTWQKTAQDTLEIYKKFL